MAAVRHRRQPNLHLPLPETPSPVIPPPPSTAASSAADFEKLQVLGHGNGGVVYKVRQKRTGAIYALKVVRGDADPLLRRQTFREAEILRRTDSPFVVRCYGVVESPAGWGGAAILMEFMDAGTLGLQVGRLSEQSLRQVARQVLNGLCYLHAHGIIHRDLKPSNLLVNGRMEVKISDFGVSKVMRRSLEACNSYVGTCAYMSPERFDPETYGVEYDGYKADVWSLGVTLVELYLGHFPFLPPGQTPDWATLMCAICFGDPPPLPDSASEDFRGFIACCLHKESSKRWTASQLLSHPFLAAGAKPAGDPHQ